MNMKIGIMNIQLHLQIKRLQLCPCPLCVFPQILKGELSWEKRSPVQQVLKKEPSQSTANMHNMNIVCIHRRKMILGTSN